MMGDLVIDLEGSRNGEDEQLTSSSNITIERTTFVESEDDQYSSISEDEKPMNSNNNTISRRKPVVESEDDDSSANSRGNLVIDLEECSCSSEDKKIKAPNNSTAKRIIFVESEDDDYEPSSEDEQPINSNNKTIQRKRTIIESEDDESSVSSSPVNTSKNDYDISSIDMRLGFTLKDSDCEDDEDYNEVGNGNDDDSTVDNNLDDEEYEPSNLDDEEYEASNLDNEEYEPSEEDANDIIFEGDDECSSNDESVVPLRKRKSRKKKKKSCCKPCCPSMYDAITEEELETPHICWESPNKSLKQCFNLSTLVSVAKSMAVQDFMQPPHFRSLMDDALRAQIKEKFGAKALKLNNDEDYEENATFAQRLQRYLNGVMGSSDLYLCPVCYSEAYRRYESPSSYDHPYHEFHFQHDPISVLQSLDDELHIASTFSFRKMAQVKAHLKEAHGFDTNNIDNALYKRFQIRASDGLLQRYLEFYYERDLHHTDMAKFWQSGNNIHFIHLLHLVESHFSGIPMSFNFRRRMWDELSSPYYKGLNEEDKDFVVNDHEEIVFYSDANDDSSDSSDANDSNPEITLISELRRRRKVQNWIKGPLPSSDEEEAFIPIVSISPPKSKRRRKSQTKRKRKSQSKRKRMSQSKRKRMSQSKRKRTSYIDSDSDEEDIPKRKLQRKTPHIDSDSDSEQEMFLPPQSKHALTILSTDDDQSIEATRPRKKSQIHTSDDEDWLSESNERDIQLNASKESQCDNSNTEVVRSGANNSIDSKIDAFLFHEFSKINCNE